MTRLSKQFNSGYLLAFGVSVAFASFFTSVEAPVLTGEPVGETLGLTAGLADAAGDGDATGGLTSGAVGFGSHAPNAATEIAKTDINMNDLLIDFLPQQ